MTKSEIAHRMNNMPFYDFKMECKDFLYSGEETPAKMEMLLRKYNSKSNYADRIIFQESLLATSLYKECYVKFEQSQIQKRETFIPNYCQSRFRFHLLNAGKKYIGVKVFPYAMILHEIGRKDSMNVMTMAKICDYIGNYIPVEESCASEIEACESIQERIMVIKKSVQKMNNELCEKQEALYDAFEFEVENVNDINISYIENYVRDRTVRLFIKLGSMVNLDHDMTL